MKFYSTDLDKVFDTVEELEKAEEELHSVKPAETSKSVAAIKAEKAADDALARYKELKRRRNAVRDSMSELTDHYYREMKKLKKDERECADEINVVAKNLYRELNAIKEQYGTSSFVLEKSNCDPDFFPLLAKMTTSNLFDFDKFWKF